MAGGIKSGVLWISVILGIIAVFIAFNTIKIAKNFKKALTLPKKKQRIIKTARLISLYLMAEEQIL
jgi:hypothetical protein